ncbi:hypothetical protein KC19_4G186100 [Ceratodon purpureus]|uniref:Peroxidase n=1 Tax=Ceratodon purpureus TaxID=3225 RepID=A0A8T0IC95_CERPU|nr:hypothetical protein KC19_4G186100 [Ceratodon purpureus]
MAMKTIVLVYGLVALATLLQLADAEGCPFSGSRRNLLQVAPPLPAAPAPLPGPPTGPDVFEGTLLNYDFYTQICPTFKAIVKDKVASAVAQDSLAPAFLLRLFFHDCFVQGCDGSLLLNSTVLNLAEKDQAKSFTLNMFWVIDAIKDAAEAACPGVVSCADILAATAVEAVLQAGGPPIYLAYGRRDALDSFAAAAQTNMPGGFLHVQGLIENFQNQGLNITDLVALSGAHTIGQTRCSTFVQDRFAISGNNPFPDTDYGQEIYSYCLEGTTAGVDRRVALDSNTTTLFDNAYFRSIINGRGILVSDNDLFVDSRTIPLVKQYAADQGAFFNAFAESMRKMSKIGILTGTQGQVRKQCWVRNTIDKVANPFSNFDFDPISPTICKPARTTDTPVCASS